MNFLEFEKEYLSIRTKEGRLYGDDIVKKLPFIDGKEWRIRTRSAEKLLKQLKKEKCTGFTEVGCGNGWLTNYLSTNLEVKGVGIDINKTELEQASRVFSPNATFQYADIFSLNVSSDTIIFAASIQYFPDFNKLIDSLRGTIHIIDSPFYKNARDANEAHRRSEEYFKSKDSKMKPFYFHHEFKVLEKYNYKFLYRPNRIKALFNNSPFPWVRICKE